MMRSVRIAVAGYMVDRVADLEAYEAKIVDWVSRAASEGAGLLVFPEYAAIELAASARPGPSDPRAALDVFDRLGPEVDALHRMLARRHGVHVLSAGRPERGGDGQVRCVSFLFTPGGATGRQEKIVPTPREQATWGAVGGASVAVFRTALGTVGVLVGSDAAYPLIARAEVEAGAGILLVPSASTTASAHARLRAAAMARAAENQCYVVLATMAGDVGWTPLGGVGAGAPSVFAPPGSPFPDDGMLAAGTTDEPGWIHAALDLDALAVAQEDADVPVHRDWARQGVVTGPVAEVVDLT